MVKPWWFSWQLAHYCIASGRDRLVGLLVVPWWQCLGCCRWCQLCWSWLWSWAYRCCRNLGWWLRVMGLLLLGQVAWRIARLRVFWLVILVFMVWFEGCWGESLGSVLLIVFDFGRQPPSWLCWTPGWWTIVLRGCWECMLGIKRRILIRRPSRLIGNWMLFQPLGRTLQFGSTVYRGMCHHTNAMMTGMMCWMSGCQQGWISSHDRCMLFCLCLWWIQPMRVGGLQLPLWPIVVWLSSWWCCVWWKCSCLLALSASSLH